MRRSARAWPAPRASTATRGRGDHDQAVGDLEQLVEILADHQHRAAGVAQREQRAADLRGGADVDAPGGLRHDQQLGRASISRPTMNFCRLPPDRLLAGRPGRRPSRCSGDQVRAPVPRCASR